MLKKVKHFYKKYGEVTSFSIGIFGLIFGLIQYFYPYSSKADLKYFIKESIDVVSIKENVDAIKIYFNDKDIRKDSLSLKIYKIRLKNEGESPVYQTDYASIPFGISVENGTLISIRHNSANQYLKDCLTPTIQDSTVIIFEKCIIDPLQYIDFEILLVHKSSHNPSFKAFGKIAGIEDVKIIKGDGEETDWIDILKSILLLIALLGIFFVLPIYIFEKAVEFIRRFFRKRSILKFYDYPLNSLTDQQRVIVNIVSEVGYKKFKPILEQIVNNAGEVKDLYKRELFNQETVAHFRTLLKEKIYSSESISDNKINDYDSDELFVLEELEENEFLDDKSYRVKDSMVTELEILLKKWD